MIRIELKDQESLEERKWVSTMFSLFAVQWFLFALIHLLTSIDEQFRRLWQRRLRDVGVGAILGSMIVQFFYYGQGFFIQDQMESVFIRVLAFIMQLIGTLLYTVLACLIVCMFTLVMEKIQSRN